MRRGRRLRAVIDSCVFPYTQKWLVPLVDAAVAGNVKLYWSPLIIAEANRLLTWLWLRRDGGQFTGAAWRRCSEPAHRMFARLTNVFHVIDDRPPHAARWADPPDEWDVPIWTAAVRSKADFIVTANLKDGPPPSGDGVRRYAGIVFVDPTRFLELLDWYSDVVEAAHLPPVQGTEEELPMSPDVGLIQEQIPAELSLKIEEFLRTLSKGPWRA